MLEKVQQVNFSAPLKRLLAMSTSPGSWCCPEQPHLPWRAPCHRCQPSMQMPDARFCQVFLKGQLFATFHTVTFHTIWDRYPALPWPLSISPKLEGFQVFWGASCCQSLDVGDRQWHYYPSFRCFENLKGPATSISLMDLLVFWPCLTCQDEWIHSFLVDIFRALEFTLVFILFWLLSI